MTESYSHWLSMILVFSDMTGSQNSELNNSLSTLNEKEWFGEYIKEEIRNVTQNEITTTIVINCTVRKEENNEIRRTIELHKKSGNGPLTQIEELRGENITSFKDLNEVFEKINLRFKSSRKLIITYGHGSAFGIFSQSANFLINAIKQNASVAWKFGITEFIKKNFGVIHIDDTASYESNEPYLGFKDNEIYLSKVIPDKNNFLSNEELAEAIRNNFLGVDIVIMNNCLMQNIYTQFALAGLCNFIIAPQTGITYPGFNIQTIYSNLADNSTNRLITENILKSFSELNEPIYKEYCIVGFDMTGYHDITVKIGAIKNYLAERLKADSNYYHNIKNAFNSDYGCIPFDSAISKGRSFFDILQLLSHLCTFDKSNSLKGLFDDLNDYIKVNNLCLINKGDTFHKVRQPTGRKIYNNNNLSGLSMYFPPKPEAINPILERVFNNENYESKFESEIEWSDIFLLYPPLKGYTRREKKVVEKINTPFDWVNRPGL